MGRDEKWAGKGDGEKKKTKIRKRTVKLGKLK